MALARKMFAATLHARCRRVSCGTFTKTSRTGTITMDREQVQRLVGTVPHCDARVLHAPGTCIYCDKHALWQALRVLWGIAFTNAPVLNDSLPCPSTMVRPLDVINRWAGNRPVPLHTTNDKDSGAVAQADGDSARRVDSLLHCPFCGSTEVEFEWVESLVQTKPDPRSRDCAMPDPDLAEVRCRGCGAKVYSTTEQGAVERWNTRWS